ncbi:putative phage integrase domain protein [Synechococcus sp. BIOS-E4-1]|nr:putative phage integrase domain protein [Synechococcus sp. BIOS-E4-1]
MTIQLGAGQRERLPRSAADRLNAFQCALLMTAPRSASPLKGR